MVIRYKVRQEFGGDTSPEFVLIRSEFKDEKEEFTTTLANKVTEERIAKSEHGYDFDVPAEHYDNIIDQVQEIYRREEDSLVGYDQEEHDELREAYR